MDDDRLDVILRADIIAFRSGDIYLDVTLRARRNGDTRNGISLFRLI